MAVRIRLRRLGKLPKKRPYFRVTVFEENKGRDSRFIEEIGSYNPVNGEVKIKKDRLEHWLKVGAQMTESLKSLSKKIR